MPPKLWGDSCFQNFGSNLCLNLPHIIHHQIFYQVQSPQHHTYQLAWSCQDSPAFYLSVPQKLCPGIIAQSSLWLPWPSTPTQIGCVHSSFVCKSCNVSFICKSPPYSKTIQHNAECVFVGGRAIGSWAVTRAVLRRGSSEWKSWWEVEIWDATHSHSLSTLALSTPTHGHWGSFGRWGLWQAKHCSVEIREGLILHFLTPTFFLLTRRGTKLLTTELCTQCFILHSADLCTAFTTFYIILLHYIYYVVLLTDDLCTVCPAPN